tara:strand:+ start:317 stop:1162 length:846 start_codon:yes stop_codon:yes gene_type:complete
MNYLEAINIGSSILKFSKIDSYRLDSEILLSSILNSTREKVLINQKKKLKLKNFQEYKRLILRRKTKEPIAQILNNKEFWKLNFFINRNVLVPRPETELIVEELLNCIDLKSSKRILDIGTGSGCIIISAITERPNCKGCAIDISKKALDVAKYNAKMHHIRNKIKFINKDIDKFIDNNYDFILSNPPYIKKFELKRLDGSVNNFEPHIALEAGLDGFREIKKIILKSKKLLKINGKLIFEIGNKQINKSMLYLNKYGFYINKVIKDLNSFPRVIVATNKF